MNKEREKIVDLGEWVSSGEIVAFNPAGYVLQMIEAEHAGKEMSFEGMRRDLEAVVAETLLEVEFREIKYEVSFNQEGKLIWLAPGNEGRRGGTVIDMAETTVERYKKMAEDESLSKEEKKRVKDFWKRFFWEGEQLKTIIKTLENGGEGHAVLGVLPDNDVVYPVSAVNYLTVYSLKNGQIVATPLMNRYSNRLLSSLFKKEDLSEEELITSVVDLGKNVDPKQVFRGIDKLVSVEERGLGLVGELIDRTSDVTACNEVIDSAALFLEKIIKLELKNLDNRGDWNEIRGRLNVAWELAMKNIVGFISGEKYLIQEELLDKVDLYINQINGKFSRNRLFEEIISKNDLKILTREVVASGACGSLNFSGMDGSLSGSMISNLGEKKMVKNCGQCGAGIYAEIGAGYKCPSCGAVYQGC